MARSHAPAARRDVATNAPSRRWTLTNRKVRIAFLVVVAMVIFPIMLGYVMSSAKNASQQINGSQNSGNSGSNPGSGVVPPVFFSTSTPAPEPTPTVTPTPTSWPTLQVNWTIVTDLLILPPAEEGFYNGTMQNEPYGASGNPECRTYAHQILPELTDPKITPMTVGNVYQTGDVCAVTRDLSHQIVLAGFGIVQSPMGEPLASRLLLSADGEKTWREINLIPAAFEGAIVLPWETRVASRNGSVLLFVRGGGGAARNGHWWTATLATQNNKAFSRSHLGKVCLF